MYRILGGSALATGGADRGLKPQPLPRQPQASFLSPRAPWDAELECLTVIELDDIQGLHHFFFFGRGVVLK